MHPKPHLAWLAASQAVIHLPSRSSVLHPWHMMPPCPIRVTQPKWQSFTPQSSIPRHRAIRKLRKFRNMATRSKLTPLQQWTSTLKRRKKGKLWRTSCLHSQYWLQNRVTWNSAAAASVQIPQLPVSIILHPLTMKACSFSVKEVFTRLSRTAKFKIKTRKSAKNPSLDWKAVSPPTSEPMPSLRKRIEATRPSQNTVVPTTHLPGLPSELRAWSVHPMPPLPWVLSRRLRPWAILKLPRVVANP